MRQQWIAPASLIAALLIVITTALTPTGSTLAMWFEELTTDELSAQTDSYTLDFADVPSTGESTNPAQPPVWNQPSFTVTNESSTLAREMRITRTQLTSRYSYDDSTLEPVRNSRITFALAPAGQTCISSEREQVWTAKEAGQAPPANGIFTPPGGGATFMLAAGETRHMCIDITLDTASSTVDQRRSLLRRFAGAGIKAFTDIGPAQTLSTDGRESGSVTSLYRVSLPQPVPSPSITSNGVTGCQPGRMSDSRGYMRLQWGWPDASGSSAVGTSVIDRWEVWSKPTGGSWSKTTDGYYVRPSDGVFAPEYPSGNIPASERHVYVERGIIRRPALDGNRVHSDFAIVGVLKNSAQTRFVAAQGWDLSWNGVSSPLWNQYLCHSTFTTPGNLTGAPNVPGRQW
ncbi:hypothetical protein [Brevibacterium luteolum]|uniref:hypothetical protein n=1 Tax=Brevibacterium luteolum TaxID=199591 RepID=UPI00223AF0C7|nr:hypothetical protein [Brevibacterium luteolum]MCT1872266.1 hypothetical protein [Brevibacterium luteolum]MCT1889525.1 hypothetical protein [Brevibacterium luteolum]MCT1892083.1 hypothetical protein [Brevibacterium luteolum]MCT1922848.1 hypothetical protein [Brevibacterium luteolum]